MAEQQPHGDLEGLLGYLHEQRHFDFRGYKRASLARRIEKRMQLVGVETYADYIDLLEANPAEFAALFDTILINVTSLNRDPDAWELMAERILPAIVEGKGPDEALRVWSAGCASGEEAYTLAVLLAETLGEDRFRRTVKIYATDADEGALAVARQARYGEDRLVEAFGPERTRRFFELGGGVGVFRSDLRRALIFGRHDLVQDPPISRVDLITCRNTLMYFTADTQSQVLSNFGFALRPGGYLMLGKAETLVTRGEVFELVDLHQHVFRKIGGASEPSRLQRPRSRPERDAAPAADRVAEASFEQLPVAALTVDGVGIVSALNRAARRSFGLGSADVGRPARELELPVGVDALRTLVDRVLRDRRVASITDVDWTFGGEEASRWDVVAGPLDALGGAVLVFADVSRFTRLREELDEARRELQTAYEELQSTVEELETTNEELQSTNEELETTNEELHSTNEELETMNEELQSTNEELESTNNELRDRNAQVAELNQFLSANLASLESAVVVLGGQMEVRAWNRQAEELWGLRADEVVGHHFLNLDIGFPVERLGGPIREILSGRSEQETVTSAAVNRRGRPVECTVTARALRDAVLHGVILTMDAAVTETVPTSSGPAAS